jgi:hypothetical protein
MKSERLIYIIPPYYRKSKIAHGILGATERESDRLVAFALDVIRQGNPITATWGLSQWEEGLKLPAVPESTPLHVRTARVLARLRLPPVITPKEMEKIAGQFTQSKTAQVIEYGREKRFVIVMDIDDVIDLSYLIEAVKEAKPAHLIFAPRLQIIGEQIAMIHHVTQKIKLNVKTDPWALANGDIGKSPFLDGTGRLNGGGFLTGRAGMEGPAHVINLRYRMPIIHTFGVHTEIIGPIIDGSGRLSGKRQLDGVLREETVPVKHSTRMWKQMRETIVLAPTNTESLKVKSIATTGARVLRGTGRLDGSRTLNNLFYQQPATLRVIKNGVVTEEIAI